MIGELKELVSVAIAKDQLTLLIKQKQLSVHLVTEKEEAFLLFSNGKISVVTTATEYPPVATIMGNEEAISLLLTGHLKLRIAVKQDLISWKGHFRTSLFLESFFYLAKNQYPSSARAM